ncbi:hypothetical protein, partial [Ralstonia pseudosolanacearum]|uniref:hypothetical protein n=1 Tax=Ralstonia pseudosolanacearum TaxID=1310165 RepID=UPI003CF7822C
GTKCNSSILNITRKIKILAIKQNLLNRGFRYTHFTLSDVKQKCKPKNTLVQQKTSSSTAD